MHQRNVDPGLRRFAVLLACCTFGLVIAGALVTSNDAALSVPDWPFSWGRLVPTLEGGIRYEFTHRVMALLAAIFTTILAVRLRTRLAWTALGLVLGQAALGGMVVKFVTPAWATIGHACLAQLYFAVVTAIVVDQYVDGSAPGGFRSPAPVVAAVALFAQTILGAAVRYNVVIPVAHIAGAAVATILVMWAGLSILMQHMENAALRRPAMALLTITFSQVFLGIGAYMARVAFAGAPQPMPMVVWFTVAHVAVGSLALGAAVALAMIVYRQPRNQAVMANGGIAIA
uniref:Cytochrome oxidase assembly n=1 Tax=Solibacter usitatus (strain Ellin6076) TaxID=234267 RepID=Q01YC1_SOLUE